MSKRKLQVFNRYRYGAKGILLPGDRFRVTGGPIYVTDDGAKIPMYERGEFVFHHLCIHGAARWIEAYRGDGGGHVVLWVGRTCRSKDIPNLRRRPYRITRKLRDPHFQKTARR